MAAVTAPSVASAQQATSEGLLGLSLNRYDPTPIGDVFFASEHPTYTGERTWRLTAGLILDYARKPLVLRNAEVTATGVREDRDIISDTFLTHFGATLSIFDRVGFSLSLPVSFVEAGRDQTGEITGLDFHARTAPAVGDLRLGARVRIFQDAERNPFSLHAGGYAYIPLMANSAVSDGFFHGRLYVNMAGRGGSLIRWSATIGYHGRRTWQEFDATVGHELYFTAALGFTFLDGRLTVGPEIFTAATLATATQPHSWPVEAQASLHYLIANQVLIGAGIGPGFTQAIGTPQLRALFTLAYAPAVNAPAGGDDDPDRDGVRGARDECPNEPQGRYPDPAKPGCPIRDTDRDGVPDPQDRCPTEPRGNNPDPARPGCPLRDRDRDGVFDNRDVCPDVPQGQNPDPDRPGCPDEDTDHDGVFDHQDQCRTVPAGTTPDPARPGCPLADRDGDRVPDNVDHCPDQFGAPSTDPNRNGCPGLIEVRGNVIRILTPVYFATNRDVILSRSYPVLMAVADTLRVMNGIRRVSIEGHTDSVGADDRNMDLSQRRANSVMRFLVERNIDAGRLEAHGFGETRPIDTNSTSAGRQVNRRVEFRIVDPLEGSATGTGTPN